MFGLTGLLAQTPKGPKPPAGVKSPIAVTDLYSLAGPREPALSPDGKTLVYVRQWIDTKEKIQRSSLWIAEGSVEKARALEWGEPDAHVPTFAPDGKRVAFLSSRPRPEGWIQTPGVPSASDPAMDVWLVPVGGGTALPLAGPDKPYGRVFNDGFYGGIAFSPDGTKLAFVADDGRDPRTPAEKSAGVQIVRNDQGEGYEGYGPAQVWIAHLDPKPGKFAASRIERLTDDDVWYGDPNWSPNNSNLAVHANRSGDRESVRYSINKNFDIWSINVDTRKLTQLTKSPGPQVSPRYSPDGKWIACLTIPRKGSHRDAFSLALIVAADPEAPLWYPFDHSDPLADRTGHPIPSFPLPRDCWDGNGAIIVTAEDGIETYPARIDISSGGGEKFTPTSGKLTEPPKTLGERMVRTIDLLPDANQFLRDRLVAPQKGMKWKSFDGLEIEGILTVPPAGIAKSPYKLVVYPHGGPHGRSVLGFDFTVQVLASHGYAVFQPNFRGSTGYGQKFIDADRGDFGGGDMKDIMSGIDKLIAEGIADKDRLFVYGTSYGGFMSTWLVGHTERFRAAVAQNPVTDLTMMWYLSDIPSWTEWEFGGKPWQVPEKMKKFSPLTYAEQVKTPTLILHAREDRRCPLPMGQAFHKALATAGVPSELVIYPDEGHAIRQPRHREDVYRRILDWFEKYDKK
jgi:dipeptidyl aminopeptidase/acylaminoacyl peptidase